MSSEIRESQETKDSSSSSNFDVDHVVAELNVPPKQQDPEETLQIELFLFDKEVKTMLNQTGQSKNKKLKTEIKDLRQEVQNRTLSTTNALHSIRELLGIEPEPEQPVATPEAEQEPSDLIDPTDFSVPEMEMVQIQQIVDNSDREELYAQDRQSHDTSVDTNESAEAMFNDPNWMEQVLQSDPQSDHTPVNTIQKPQISDSTTVNTSSGPLTIKVPSSTRVAPGTIVAETPVVATDVQTEKSSKQSNAEWFSKLSWEARIRHFSRAVSKLGTAFGHRCLKEEQQLALENNQDPDRLRMYSDGTDRILTVPEAAFNPDFHVLSHDTTETVVAWPVWLRWTRMPKGERSTWLRYQKIAIDVNGPRDLGEVDYETELFGIDMTLLGRPNPTPNRQPEK